jgi:ribulose 1,5-bisphosphate synthetase/thiazole synthase
MYEAPAILDRQSTMNIEHELGEGDASAILDVIVIGAGQAGLAAGSC